MVILNVIDDVRKVSLYQCIDETAAVSRIVGFLLVILSGLAWVEAC